MNKSVGNYLSVNEFTIGESRESIYNKVKSMFSVVRNFTNEYNLDIYKVESQSGLILESNFDLAFQKYENAHKSNTIEYIEDLISNIGKFCIESMKGYDNFLMKKIEAKNSIAIVISLIEYCI